MTQQTTSTAQPDLELKQKEKDQDGGESEAAEDIVRALEDAIARGEIEVQTLGENVVVNFTPTDSEENDLPQLLRETMEAIEKVQEEAGKTSEDVLIGGLNQELSKLMADASAALQALKASDQATQQAASEQQDKNERAKIAEDELKVALRQDIGEGLVAVEREEDKVIITVGAGGAFASGSAELTASAKEIMANIAGVNAKGSGKITVSGHTDNVPLIFGSQFRDNWDLAAARSASVVQALEGTGKIPASRMEAVSFGESAPIESNSTSEGRAVNRRIEIEINY
jgi:chemotaxis protein MotB